MRIQEPRQNAPSVMRVAAKAPPDTANEALEERENQVRGRVSTKTEQGNRLLFVDDEPSIRLTLPPLLQERGFQVQIAASVSEALTAIKAHKFDVLLSDQTSTLTEKAMDSPSSTPCEKPIPIA